MVQLYERNPDHPFGQRIHACTTQRDRLAQAVALAHKGLTQSPGRPDKPEPCWPSSASIGPRSAEGRCEGGILGEVEGRPVDRTAQGGGWSQDAAPMPDPNLHLWPGWPCTCLLDYHQPFCWHRFKKTNWGLLQCKGKISLIPRHPPAASCTALIQCRPASLLVPEQYRIRLYATLQFTVIRYRCDAKTMLCDFFNQPCLEFFPSHKKQCIQTT